MTFPTKLKNEDRLVMLDYLRFEYTGTFYITYSALDQHKLMEEGTAKAFLKTLLKETGWELDHETPSGQMLMLRRIEVKK